MSTPYSADFIKKAIRELWRTERVDDATFLPLPFPKIYKGRMAIVFAPCLREGPIAPKERLFAPTFLAYASIPELKPIQFEVANLSDIGFGNIQEGDPIGYMDGLDHLPPGMYSTKQNRYFELLSVLLERKIYPSKSTNAETKRIADEILEILECITLPALAKYYEWAGSELKEWCRKQKA